MSKKLKTIQWNIGGGKARATGRATHLISEYNLDYLDNIILLLKAEDPDIITLQEIHADENSSQVDDILNALGMKYSVSDFYADSHIEAGKKLGQAIISKHPLSSHEYEQFFNPKYEAEWEDGSVAVSHDKGLTKCNTHIGNIEISLKTLHAIPFRRFNIEVDSGAIKPVLVDMQSKILDSYQTVLLQGDFNINRAKLTDVLPELFESDFKEVIQNSPTTPKGFAHDHILFKGMKYLSSRVDNTVITDHFPIISEFEL